MGGVCKSIFSLALEAFDIPSFTKGTNDVLE